MPVLSKPLPQGLIAPIVLLLAVLGAAGAPAAGAGPAAQPTVRAWEQTTVWRPSYDPGAILQPGGLAVAAGGRLYVADRGHDRIAVVDATGQVVEAFGRRGGAAGEFRSPRDVAVDAARGRVYVVDYGNKRLAVLDLSGNPIAQWQRAAANESFVPIAATVAPSTGEVYVLSQRPEARVDRFAADGAWLGGWGADGSSSGSFLLPEDIAALPDGRVLVADTGNNRVQVFSATGLHLNNLAPLGNVHAVAVDAASGRLLALHDSGSGVADVVAVFASTGTPQAPIRSDNLAEGFGPGGAIAVGPGGGLIVSTGDWRTAVRQGVRQYDAGGSLVAATLASPLDHGGFVWPSALDVGPDGDVYLVDGPLGLTKRYGPEGAYRQQIAAGHGREITVGPMGELYLVETSGEVRLRRIQTDGTLDWEKPCDCLAGMGLAATSNRVYATAAISRSVEAFDLDRANEDPVGSFTVPNPPYAWPLDVDLGPDRYLYAAGGDNGRIDVIDPAAGRIVGGWALGSGNGAERIAVAADGLVVALLYDGSVAAFQPDGSLAGLWYPEPIPGAATVLPQDLAVGPNGRVYVLDGASGAVLVYDPATSEVPTPAPTRPAGQPCTVSGDKVAVPDTITLGEEVTVRLTLDIRCRAGEEPRADIMLILDRSNSMGDGSLPGTKLYEAKAAAHEFVRQIDLTRHRLGLVSFSEIISLDQPLTTDAAAVHAAIDAVQISGLTDIATALERANEHIALARRPEALPVLLLLSDGKPLQPGQPYVDTARQGARARARGLLVYAIGLGADVDAALLTAVAGSGQRYFFAPRPEDLQPIYARLSESVGDVVARDVEIVDEMGPDVDFVAGSASDGPTVAGNRLTWGFATLGGTKTMTLRVKPRRTGRLPTNTQAVARHVAEGVPYSFTFPVPQVRVLDAPTATPTLTATPLPTATPTRRPSTPSRVFLPILMRDLCRLKDAQLGADIVLVIDTSSSMTGAKLEAAKAAARVFLALVDPDRDRVGLVSFDGTARRDYLITADLAGVARSLGNLSLGQGSRIDLGLVEARTELGRRARRGSQRVVVLLSDGLPTPGYEGATRSAAAVLTGTGSTLFTVGLGADASGPLLRGLASTPLHYYAAPNPADLELIYRRIARSLPCR